MMRYALFIAVLLLGLSAYVQFGAGNAGDKDWLLYAAGMALKGKKLYRDIIEVNPPLILWLYTLPAYISLKTGIDDSDALVALGLAASAFSIFLCVQLVKAHPTFGECSRRRINLALLLTFVLVIRTVPSYFADRDHIFLVLTLPYVLRWLPLIARTTFPLPFRALIGVMAAIGFCIKPHCLIVLAGIQLLTLVRERSFAILFCFENVLIDLGVTAYVLCVFLFVPDYVHTVFPMVLATYGALNRRIDGILYGAIAAFTLAVAFSEFRPRQDSPYRRDIYYLLVLCFFFLLYAATNNGWGYSYNPLICYALITTAWLIWHFSWLRVQMSDRKYTFGFRAGMTALYAHVAVAALLLVMTVAGTGSFHCEDSSRCMLGRALLKEVKTVQGPRSFSTLSPVVGSWSELSRESGAAWDSRFNHLWMLPKFVSSGTQFLNEHRWILEFVAHAVALDLKQSRPEVVFVDIGIIHTAAGPPFNIPASLSAYPDFKEEWRHYRFGQTLDYCDKPKNGETANMNILGCDFDVYYRAP